MLSDFTPYRGELIEKDTFTQESRKLLKKVMKRDNETLKSMDPQDVEVLLLILEKVKNETHTIFNCKIK